MIIMCQNKKAMVDYKDITIKVSESLDNHMEHILYSLDAFLDSQTRIILGYYKTEERAKEVLHDIVFSSAKIYEMPKE